METELTALEVTTGHITWGAGDAGLNLNHVTHWEFEPHDEDAAKDRIVLRLGAPAMVTGTVDQAVVSYTGDAARAIRKYIVETSVLL